LWELALEERAMNIPPPSVIIIIQFNSIQFIYVQNLTAQRPITKLAQARK
jgi:hypothetical protein